MKLNPETLDETLENFLTVWPVYRLRTMNVEEYADLSNHDSFCYWLEYGTKNLGEIGAVSLNKFELWKPKEAVDFKDDRYKTNGVYAWNRNRGETLREAFADVRNQILQIITYSQLRDWEAIDKVPFHQIGKWKIAFLYSDKTLLPVYSKRALLAIAKGLGQEFPYQTKVSFLQNFIIERKPENESMGSFAYNQYVKFASKAKPNFYIIGSKYRDDTKNENIPKIKEFIQNRCVAIGFMGDIDFSSYMGANKDAIKQFVYENWEEEKPALPKIQRYFSLLSQIKAGDIIAVKSHGSHNQLTIIAYAQVVERNGRVYEHNEEQLGHHINVEFLEKGLYLQLGLTYAETIHQLNFKKHGEDFIKVFGWYADIKLEEEVTNESEEEDFNEDNESGYNEKSEDDGERGPIASTIFKRVHNRIQNRFIKYLKATYPNDIVSGEKKRIDAMRENNRHVLIYEIKPFASVHACVREGVGQLLDYSHKNNTNKQKKILIVGQNSPKENDQHFIDSIRAEMRIPFAYIAFDELNLSVTEF